MRSLLPIARKALRVRLSIRHSLRPLIFEGGGFQDSGQSCRGNESVCPLSAVVPRLACPPKPWRRRDRGIQYAAASRLKHYGLWNTGSPAFAGDDTECGLKIEDEAVRSKMQDALVPWHSPRAAGEIAENILRVSLSSSFSLPSDSPMPKGEKSRPGTPAQQHFSAA